MISVGFEMITDLTGEKLKKKKNERMNERCLHDDYTMK
jgi:hypothetical protein